MIEFEVSCKKKYAACQPNQKRDFCMERYKCQGLR